MENLFIILLTALFVNNIVLTKFLGICPFIGVSRRTGPALGMSFAVLFVMTIGSVVSWLMYTFLLEPLGLEYLMILIFIFIIASLVQFTELFIKAYSDKLYKSLGIYLPLITTNCAILGVAFLNIMEEFNFIEALVYSVGSGIGFMLALLLMSAIRERLELGNVPEPFKGVPVAFVIAAMMSLVFLGFGALIR